MAHAAWNWSAPMIHRLQALLTRCFAPPRRRLQPLSDQNGRDAVRVSDQELLRARDDLIRRDYLGRHAADKAAGVRNNWPLEKLTTEAAELWSNGKVFTLTARSGFGISLMPGAREVDLAPDIDDAALGTALNDILSYSRELSLHDWYHRADPNANSLPERTAQYRARRDSLMRRHGYKTQRTLYTHMLHVTLRRRAGMLCCSPSDHVRINAWEGVGPNSEVAVAADGSPAALGAALRLALSRCLDTYGKKTRRAL